MIPDCGRKVREQGLDMVGKRNWYRLIAKIEFGKLEKKVLVLTVIAFYGGISFVRSQLFDHTNHSS